MPTVDGDLDGLLAKLYTIQSDVGANGANANAAQLPSANPKMKGDRFMELKSSLLLRFSSLKELIQDARDTEKAGGDGSGGGAVNAKEIILKQSKIREEIRMAGEEWREIEGIYRVESKKKRSKFTPAELSNQQHIVLQLKAELDKIKTLQRSGYTNNGNSRQDGGFVARNVATIDDSELFNSLNSDLAAKGESGGVSTDGVEMTASQAAQVAALKERDAQFDKDIALIGEGIEHLQDMALAQNEEVKRQNMMLDGLAGQIDNVHEHVTNVNSKMKDTLKEVGRRGDKFCVDLICIVFAIGFAAVLYSIYKNQ